MSAFFEKKEADISGMRNPRANGPRRTQPADRRGKGKENGNGNHHAEGKPESPAPENVKEENEDKEDQES